MKIGSQSYQTFELNRLIKISLFGHDERELRINEVIKNLQPHGSGIYVDCTFGRGGYSQAILNKINHEGRVLALDADPDAIKYGSK